MTIESIWHYAQNDIILTLQQIPLKQDMIMFLVHTRKRQDCIGHVLYEYGLNWMEQAFKYGVLILCVLLVAAVVKCSVPSWSRRRWRWRATTSRSRPRRARRAWCPSCSWARARTSPTPRCSSSTTSRTSRYQRHLTCYTLNIHLVLHWHGSLPSRFSLIIFFYLYFSMVFYFLPWGSMTLG